MLCNESPVSGFSVEQVFSHVPSKVAVVDEKPAEYVGQRGKPSSSSFATHSLLTSPLVKYFIFLIASNDLLLIMIGFIIDQWHMYVNCLK